VTGVIPDGFAGLRELKRVLLNDNRLTGIVLHCIVLYCIELNCIELLS
jgi:hypothetical protein